MHLRVNIEAKETKIWYCGRVASWCHCRLTVLVALFARLCPSLVHIPRMRDGDGFRIADCASNNVYSVCYLGIN